MKKILVYSDSLFADLNIPESLIPIHVESFPGYTAEEAVQWSKDANNPLSLSFFVEEDDYDTVIICFGTNDIGHDELPQNVIENVLLQNIAAEKGIRVFLTMLTESVHHNSKTFNKLLKSKMTASSFDFFEKIDETLLYDGLHLGEEGKSKLLENLVSFLEPE